MKTLVLALCFLLFIPLSSALAQSATPQAGDACSQQGQFAGNYNSGAGAHGHLLICDGTEYVVFMEFNDNGQSLFQIDYDSGACTSAKSGRLRYNDTTDTWEYCDGSTWSGL